MLDTIRLILLRRKARSHVSRVYAIMASHDCGNRLTLELRPDVWKVARKADAIMDRIAKLDPNVPMDRITPMLEDMAR